ncbi:Predicted arabinose efflux permease, MFS family [Pseudomonas arsenicoxydans]|uniref:Predicted arabinose efflux permease, MFS family n=1 Tax=Pseudomonas arsenicoxydans TaxID=702115 RepID=A0A1H0JT24_9PSED|nr:MFS transporter [Pseudomonas arsenicoxydans]SDO46699.1 Predicted arabinose efflux permease, MFS family [Pseudomonas arsenicoxydans]
MSYPISSQRTINRVGLVWAMGIAQILAWSTTYYLPAVLATPIARETEWSITSTVAGLSWGLLVAGACSPLVGRQIDLHGGRPVLATSSILMALGLLLMGVAGNLVIYYLAWTFIGVAMAAGLYDAAFSTLGRLFGDSARTSMTGLTLLGGFASTLGWPLIAGLEHQIGWRYSCVTLAAAHLVIGLPIHLLLIPKSESIPNSDTAPTDDSAAATAHHTKSGNRLFLLLAALLTLQSLVISSVSVHLLNVLKLLGIATATALAIGMMIGPSQVVARLAEFSFGRNLHPTTSAKAAILLSGIGIGLLVPAIPWLAFIAMALYGAGNGILTIARGTLPLALFGQDGYGARMGLLARSMMIAQAVGPVAAAVILDKLGSTPLLVVMCVLATASLIASFGLPSK